MTRVKICGITNLDDARLCVEAGADALGFIFVENTPRFVTPELVAPIVRQLPPFVTPVGIFWDHPAGHVKAVAEACGLRALQFHSTLLGVTDCLLCLLHRRFATGDALFRELGNATATRKQPGCER